MKAVLVKAQGFLRPVTLVAALALVVGLGAVDALDAQVYGPATGVAGTGQKAPDSAPAAVSVRVTSRSVCYTAPSGFGRVRRAVLRSGTPGKGGKVLKKLRLPRKSQRGRCTRVRRSLARRVRGDRDAVYVEVRDRSGRVGYAAA